MRREMMSVDSLFVVIVIRVIAALWLVVCSLFKGLFNCLLLILLLLFTVLIIIIITLWILHWWLSVIFENLILRNLIIFFSILN